MVSPREGALALALALCWFQGFGTTEGSEVYSFPGLRTVGDSVLPLSSWLAGPPYCQAWPSGTVSQGCRGIVGVQSWLQALP